VRAGAPVPESIAAARRIVDVSHVVESGMQTYPGLPAPLVCDFLSRMQSRARYAAGTEFHFGRIDMVGNTGTYIDSPFHRYDDGVDIADLPLARLVDLRCVVVRIPRGVTRIDAGVFRGMDVARAAVLVHTGWDRHWRTAAYAVGHPFLDQSAAELLVAGEACLVGIDSLNIDGTDTGERPVHSVLLAAGIPIVEHLCNLRAVPLTGARFHAAPVAVRGMGTFPVRAWVMA